MNGYRMASVAVADGGDSFSLDNPPASVGIHSPRLPTTNCRALPWGHAKTLPTVCVCCNILNSSAQIFIIRYSNIALLLTTGTGAWGPEIERFQMGVVIFCGIVGAIFDNKQ